ncbi:MAG: endonuclease/exonuclease/phosphatase [Gemmatimonadetes bacterium]|nr:endonuclease/exonuclease/phosphatase family protein [Gemmatimonadota bacterium]NIR77883.1 endonuclease/exonuclease/phosphatase family protein [Gemmatimonadota bacterium]NIT86428.1 endonuclease/exonuclease/phosphatase family protein [Gemmatimonadota bacterium]NIU30265.1 endonuclease/exonuclease/phosphatase family protein [Gemmatimonadota bacterium]NIU35169.1 endonuclease/exonuclease/phosphatase [Gemmatimonadota bacterium]
MPSYQRLDVSRSEDARTVERLLALRRQLREDVPDRTLQETLLLATWNIRDFDRPQYGPRLEEAIYYIAEIIAHFDIVAVQEVYKNLTGLERVMEVLGAHWDSIVTDVTAGERGNDERMAFLYDTRTVKLGGLTGELVLPPIEDEEGDRVPADQIWRTPFIAGFRSGWCDFMLATVHIQWGASEAEALERVSEVRKVARFLRARTEDEDAWARNLILLGDFNIYRPGNLTFRQLTDADFVIPEELRDHPSNANKVRHYDQIAFRVRPGSLDFVSAGVFDYYRSVFRDEDEEIYVPHMGERYHTTREGKPKTDRGKTNYYRTYWRTNQMSDHLPMWVQLQIDYSDEYLERKLEG